MMAQVSDQGYTVEVRGGGNEARAAGRLAQVIIDRWRPNNRGGIHYLLGPSLARGLLPFFRRATIFGQPITLRISVENNRPLIAEVL